MDDKETEMTEAAISPVYYCRKFAARLSPVPRVSALRADALSPPAN